ncbi:hypothetical protein [Phaeobacter porticola]|uniref:Uncharacterized protein n=1 Tax=Phaeobacter porticola TaxID=1844006 RepID=A0A1L3I8X3_9RHOB|nr:hypothetical protein [Phaeobacter porticola]APG48473.1 hypothetical protein PhaeoP97_03100 [Phaeobacter porticola]
MSEQGKFHDKYVQQLIKGASDKITGPRVTANIRNANCVRCPQSGELAGRNSDQFRRMEVRFAPR